MSKKIQVKITHRDKAELAGKPALIVNGKSYEYELDKEIELDEPAVLAAEASDALDVTRLSDKDGEGVGAAAPGEVPSVDNLESNKPDSTMMEVEDKGTSPVATATDGPAPNTETGGQGDSETSSDDGSDSDSFDANTVIDGNLSGKDGVEARIAKIDSEQQLDAVLKAEKDADGRQGVTDAVEKRRAQIKES